MCFRETVIVLHSAGPRPLLSKTRQHAIPSGSPGMVALEPNQQAVRDTVPCDPGGELQRDKTRYASKRGKLERLCPPGQGSPFIVSWGSSPVDRVHAKPWAPSPIHCKQVWWRTPVILALGKQKLSSSAAANVQCQPGTHETLCQKKKKNRVNEYTKRMSGRL